MLSILDNTKLRERLEQIAAGIKDNIRNKPIDRKTPSKGNFRSVVNSSGALAESINYTLTSDDATFFALDYIDKLIYGQEKPEPTLFEIELWLGHKGLDLNQYAVSTNLWRNGSSIWQQHRGNDSGLIGEYVLNGEVNADLAEEIAQIVADFNIDKLTRDVLN